MLFLYEKHLNVMLKFTIHKFIWLITMCYIFCWAQRYLYDSMQYRGLTNQSLQMRPLRWYRFVLRHTKMAGGTHSLN
jgi:hypothetical protein